MQHKISVHTQHYSRVSHTATQNHITYVFKKCSSTASTVAYFNVVQQFISHIAEFIHLLTNTFIDFAVCIWLSEKKKTSVYHHSVIHSTPRNTYVWESSEYFFPSFNIKLLTSKDFSVTKNKKKIKSRVKGPVKKIKLIVKSKKVDINTKSQFSTSKN